mgnify:FL=1
MSDENILELNDIVNVRQTEYTIPKMPKSITTAISNVMVDIKTLEYDDKNSFQNYSYASIDGFLKLVRPICAKHGLVIITEEDDVKVEKYGERPFITIKYKFILSHKDGETWGFRPSRTMMVEVKGGQSFGSAMAYTLKQFMRALFLIDTGEKDDLDGDEQNMQKPSQPKPTTKTFKHNTERRTS